MDRLRRLLVSVLMMGLLASCGGSDGEDGKSGEVVPVITETTSLILSVLSVESNTGHIKVNFEATSSEGVRFVGLNQPRMTVAKLIPAKNGNSSEWKSFIYNDVEQATYDKDGEFVDNNNGTYSYTFSNDVLNVAGVPWDERTTHRVAMQVSENSGKHPAANGVYDWVPSGETLIHTRDIVATESCNNCHTKIAMHGGSRLETGYCVTCHNPSTTDPESGNTVDFKVMVHKIHMGKELPGIAAEGDGAKYSIVGYKGTEHTYSENIGGTVSGVPFPQDIRNCTNCHVSEDDKLVDPTIAAVATPDGDNWKNIQNMETCGSCHDDVAFTQAQWDANSSWMHKHSAKPEDPEGVPSYGKFPVENEDCSACHGPSNQYGSVAGNHTQVLSALDAMRDSVVLDIKAITYAAGNLDVTVGVSIGGTPITALTDLTDNLSKEMQLLANWDQGSGYEISYSANEIAVNATNCPDPVTNGAFTCSKSTIFDNAAIQASILAGLNPTIAVTITDGIVCVDNSGVTDCASGTQMALNPPKAFFNPDGSKATTYVEKVGADVASCNSCHNDLTGHHSQAAGGAYDHAAKDLAQCTSCHNATRGAFYNGRPADLKFHVHAAHGQKFAQYTDGHGFDEYPGKLNNCESCHTSSQYDLPNSKNTRPSVAWSGAPFGSPQAYTSPTAVVCASCHIGVPVGAIDPSDLAGSGLNTEQISTANHFIGNGAVFGAGTAAEATGTEACATCHAKGSEFGVDKVHGLTE